MDCARSPVRRNIATCWTGKRKKTTGGAPSHSSLVVVGMAGASCIRWLGLSAPTLSGHLKESSRDPVAVTDMRSSGPKSDVSG